MRLEKLHLFSRIDGEMRCNVRSIAVVCMLLIVLVAAVYTQTGRHEFLTYDDNVYVTNNSSVANGISGASVMWAFTSLEQCNWHPVTWLSHMADVQFYGMNPCGHHLTSVVIHTISSVLLLLLLFQITGALWQSSFVAALFALHPLHVESVAWVAERKDVLSAFFWFLTLLLYSEYAAKRKPGLYFLTLFSFILGLMSKPMLVTLPLVMLMLDYWPLDRFRNKEQCGGLCRLFGSGSTRRELVQEKIPFFACSLVSSVITMIAQHSGGAIKSVDAIPFVFRIKNALITYVTYLGKTLWPHDLAVLYPISLSIPLWQAIGSLLLLLLISVATVWTGRRRPYLPVGWFWFLVTLVPVIGLIQVGLQSMADRYTYIPSIGLFIMVAWGVPDLAKGLKHREGILVLLAGTVIVVSAVVSWHQLGYWKDDISLYRHTLQVTTGNYIIHYNMGTALANKGDIDAAIGEFREALRLNPNFSIAHSNLGLALATKGNLGAAIKEYQESIRLTPNYPDAHNSLGIALADTGNIDAAIQEFLEALRLNPNYSDAHDNLEIALDKKRIKDGARKY